MKKIRGSTLFTITLVVTSFFFVIGCGGALQVATGLAGSGLASIMESKNETKKTNSETIGQIEKLQIGEYEVQMSRATYLKNPSWVLVAYLKGNPTYRIYYKDMRKIQKYMDMDSKKKKKFVRNEFLEIKNVDLDPAMSTITEFPAPPKKERTSFSVELLEEPTSSFAPR